MQPIQTDRSYIFNRIQGTCLLKERFTLNQEEAKDLRFIRPNNQSLLMYACQKDHDVAMTKIIETDKTIIDLLLETDRMTGNTPLLWAIANSSISTALVALDENIVNNPHIMKEQINKKSKLFLNTPLILACAKGAAHSCNQNKSAKTQSEIISKLLILGPNLNEQDEHGNTALHYAILHSDYELVEKLLAKGANPNITNNKNLAPFDYLELQLCDQKNILDKYIAIYTLKETPRNKFIYNLIDSKYLSLNDKKLLIDKLTIYYKNVLKSNDSDRNLKTEALDCLNKNKIHDNTSKSENNYDSVLNITKNIFLVAAVLLILNELINRLFSSSFSQELITENRLPKP